MTTTTAPVRVATPQPISITLKALCTECGFTIARTLDDGHVYEGYPWYHVETGSEECSR